MWQLPEATLRSIQTLFRLLCVSTAEGLVIHSVMINLLCSEDLTAKSLTFDVEISLHISMYTHAYIYKCIYIDVKKMISLFQIATWWHRLAICTFTKAKRWTRRTWGSSSAKSKISSVKDVQQRLISSNWWFSSRFKARCRSCRTTARRWWLKWANWPISSACPKDSLCLVTGKYQSHPHYTLYDINKSRWNIRNEASISTTLRPWKWSPLLTLCIYRKICPPSANMRGTHFISAESFSNGPSGSCRLRRPPTED